MTIALVGLLVTTGIGFGLYKFLVRHYSPTKPVLFQGIKLLRLSNTGKEKDAVISPDGNYIACVEESAGQESIWLRGVVTTNNNQLVPPAAEQYYGLTFSLDGKYVYYIAKRRNNTIGKLYRVSTSGGPSIQLVVDVDGPITLSPLGKQMAFVRGSSTGEKALIIALTDGTGEHKLASRNGLEAFSFGGPAWSPDGTIIAVGAANVSGSNRYMSIVGVKVDDGSIRDLTSQKWGGIGRVSWAPDGAGLILAATEYGRKTSSQLWYLSYPGGEARRITNDLDDYDGVSLTALGTVLVTKRTQTLASLWVTPVGDANRSQQVLSSKHDGYNGFFNRFCWMPDGKLIYTAMTNGIPSIWKMKVDGTDQERITLDDHSNSFPSVAADGHFIIFVSDRMGSNNVWRMDPDGSNLKQLTDGTEESWAQFAPDGRWVVYHRNIEGKRTIWRIPIEGGTPIQVTDYPSNCPVISADGKWICAYYRTEMKGPWRIGIIPFEGGLPVKSFDVPASVVFQSLVRLTPDGSALAYISNREGVSNIWLQPVDGSPAKQLTSFTSEQIFWFDWSLDRKQLALTRGVVSGDVVMISDTGK
jgi:Tol biopolymer transport system component